MNQFVVAAGCGRVLGSAAVFNCLRNVSLDAIRAGINATPNLFAFQVGKGFATITNIANKPLKSVASPWNPAADGKVLPRPYQQMVLHSPIARVPLVSGLSSISSAVRY